MGDVNDRTSQGRGRAGHEGQSRDEEVRKHSVVETTGTGGRRGFNKEEVTAEDRDFGNKDPQQVADDNINQNSTGRPL
jgi:hypothetical protein